jgi:hypothetical protein
MKHCPSCKTNYADDTLQFCLQDGTQLKDLPDTQQPTVVFNDIEAETVVRSPQPNQIQFDLQSPQTMPNRPQNQTTQFQPPQKFNTAMVVLLTAFVMLLLFGAGFGAWLFLGNRKGKEDVDIKINTPTPTRTPSNKNSNISPSPWTNAVNNAANALMTPTPAPDFDPEEVKSEVSDELHAWKDSMESGDLNAVMRHYASNLDYYYNGRGVSSSSVRSNKQKAFDKYYSFRVNIDNLNIVPDPSGQKATAVFKKSWEFEGSGDNNTGTVRAQFQLTKIGGRWYITGEKDL